MTLPEFIIALGMIVLVILYGALAWRLGDLEDHLSEQHIDALVSSSHYHSPDGSTRKDYRLARVTYNIDSQEIKIDGTPVGAGGLPDDTPLDYAHEIGRCPYCHESVFDDDPASIIYAGQTDPDQIGNFTRFALHRACYVAAHDGREPDPKYILAKGGVDTLWTGPLNKLEGVAAVDKTIMDTPQGPAKIERHKTFTDAEHRAAAKIANEANRGMGGEL